MLAIECLVQNFIFKVSVGTHKKIGICMSSVLILIFKKIVKQFVGKFPFKANHFFAVSLKVKTYYDRKKGC